MQHNDSAPVSRITENVTRETLPNGLTLLIKENHAAPVVALLVAVQAGYFHEEDRVSGIAHVIEHMMFKGTPARPEDEQFAREIRELGGTLNAGTYYEETSYYVVVPSRNLEQAMEIQADACQNALFDAEELAKEIEVIVQESLQKRDNPTAMLVESLYELAYDVHRLRRWRIGHPDPLRALTRDDLVRFVQDTYRPENMRFVIVGDVDTAQARELALRYWGRVPQGELRRETSPQEPEREGFRSRRMVGDTRQRLLMMGFPAPPILHPDAAPLMVLSAILSDGRSARLYRRLKEELQIANSAWASYEGFEQMGLFTLGAESIGDEPLPVEQALWQEVERICREPVSSEDLERIKTRVESRRLYAQEEVLGVARTLATYEALGDYRLSDVLLERLRAVTAEDICRVARDYLQLKRASLLEYLPDSVSLPERTAQEIEAALQSVQSASTATVVPSLPTRTLPQDAPPLIVTPATFRTVLRHENSEAKAILLPGGALLLHKERRDLPLVSLQVMVRGGKRHETRANGGITNLMLKSSLKGTPSYNSEEIANRIEALGSGIGVSVVADYFAYGFKIKKDALQAAFPIFAEVVLHPTLPAEEVEREKQAIYAEIRRQQDSNFSLAYDLFTSACYGDHPYGLPGSGVEEAVAALTPEVLTAWHARHLQASSVVVAVVGDIDEEEALALFTEEGVGRWALGVSGDSQHINAPTPLHPSPNAEKVIFRQKQQTAAALGFSGANIFSPDRVALDVLDEITSAMGGRFFRAVRGENALAYQVTSFHRSRLDAGNFVTYASTAPENELKARDLLLQECERLGREPVSAQELATAKATILGEHVIGTQTFSAQAGELAAVGIYGLPLDEPQRYLERIAAVTEEEVRDVAQRYLTTERCWLGVMRGGASGTE